MKSLKTKGELRRERKELFKKYGHPSQVSVGRGEINEINWKTEDGLIKTTWNNKEKSGSVSTVSP